MCVCLRGTVKNIHHKYTVKVFTLYFTKYFNMNFVHYLDPWLDIVKFVIAFMCCQDKIARLIYQGDRNGLSYLYFIQASVFDETRAVIAYIYFRSVVCGKKK